MGTLVSLNLYDGVTVLLTHYHLTTDYAEFIYAMSESATGYIQIGVEHKRDGWLSVMV